MRSNSPARSVDKRVLEVGCQCRSANRATIVKLNFIGLIRCPDLTLPLQSGDYINERGMNPRLSRSLGLRGCDDIGSRFFNDTESVEFQLTNDHCLSRARRASDDEPSHVLAVFAIRGSLVL